MEDDRKNKGIGDWLIWIFVIGAYCFYNFGLTGKALLIAWGLILGGVGIIFLGSYLGDKFKK